MINATKNRPCIPAKAAFAVLSLSEEYTLFNILSNVFNRDSYLLHRISLTNSNALVVFAVEVVGNAEGSSDFVLTSVSLAYCTRIVIVNREVLAKLVGKRLCRLRKLL